MVSSKFKKSTSVQASPSVCHKGTGPYACIFPQNPECPFTGMVVFDGQTTTGETIRTRLMGTMSKIGVFEWEKHWYEGNKWRHDLTIEVNLETEKIAFHYNIFNFPYVILESSSLQKKGITIEPLNTGEFELIVSLGTGEGYGIGMS